MELSRRQDKLEESRTLKKTLFILFQDLCKSKDTALYVEIRRQAIGHKALFETISQRLNTDSVSVKVNASKFENDLKEEFQTSCKLYRHLILEQIRPGPNPFKLFKDGLHLQVFSKNRAHMPHFNFVGQLA